MNRFVKNETSNFGGNIPTEISGPTPEVIPNTVFRSEETETDLRFRRKFPESLAKWKPPEAYRIFLTDIDVSTNSLVFIMRSTVKFLCETCKRGLLWKFQTNVLLSVPLMLQIASLAKMKKKNSISAKI